MQSAPASFRRFTDHTSSRSGSRPGVGRVVAGLLVGQQQAGVFRAALARRQTELGIEQDGAGVLRQHFGDVDLELLEILARSTSPPFSLASDFCSEPR